MAAAKPTRRVAVNSLEFVDQLVSEMDRLFAQLGETETLESE
jgi:hypothetical protein